MKGMLDMSMSGPNPEAPHSDATGSASVDLDRPTGSPLEQMNRAIRQHVLATEFSYDDYPVEMGDVQVDITNSISYGTTISSLVSVNVAPGGEVARIWEILTGGEEELPETLAVNGLHIEAYVKENGEASFFRVFPRYFKTHPRGEEFLSIDEHRAQTTGMRTKINNGEIDEGARSLTIAENARGFVALSCKHPVLL